MATAPSIETGTPRHLRGEIKAEDKVLRAFRGVNVTGPRTGIDDDEFYWLENAMPKSAGNLPVVYAASYKGINYAQALLFETTCNIAGVDYIFAFLADGSATYIPDVVPYISTQFAAPASFTAPVAIAYASFGGTPGILIIDPVKGYFDFNITTALTLTPISNGAIVGPLTTAAVIPSGSSLYQTLGTYASGAGYQFHSNWIVSGTPTIGAGGAGYAVGDVLAVQGGASVVTTPVLLVTTIGGGGAVTGVSVSNVGLYTGPTSGVGGANGPALVVGPALPAGVSGGLGAGATFNFNIVATGYTVVNPGYNFVSSAPPAPINLLDSRSTGPPHPVYAFASITPAGTLNGTLIAAYAGRVWIGSNKTISFTDVSSYNSFGGAGGALTINDSYLHNAVTALFATNGFLYIFGDDNIDTLSNVQVTAGVTSFSRVNLTTSIGTSFPQSIFPYYRSLCFANKYGFYLLSGATPQKISDGLDALFNTGALTAVAQAQFVGGLVAGSATVFGELCMCWTLRIVDGYTTLYGTNVTRTLIVCFFKGRWFFYYPGFDVGQMTSIPVGGVQVLHAFSLTGQLYELFAVDSTTLVTFLRTKLWDGGDPILDKEVIRAAVAASFGTLVNPALTVTTDNEYGSQPVPSINNPQIDFLTFINNLNQPLQFQNNSLQNLYFFAGFGTFEFLQGASSTTGGKYFGLSVTAQQTDIVFSLLAEQFRSTRPW